MANTVTDRGTHQSAQGGSFTYGTGVTSSAFSPAAGCELVVAVAFNGLNDSTTSGDLFSTTLTDNIGDTGGTAWTRPALCTRGSVTNGQYQERVELWTRTVGTTPGSSKTITWTAVQQLSDTASADAWCAFHIWEVSGQPASSPVGLTASPSPVTSGTTFNTDFGGVPASDSTVFGVVQDDSGSATNIAPPSSWTEDDDQHPSGVCSYEWAHLNGGSVQSPQWSGFTSGARILGCAVEIKTTAGSGTTGSAAVTLGSFAAAGTGNIINGTAAVTLASFTPVGTGTIINTTPGYIKEVGFVTNTASAGSDAITVAAGGVPAGDTIVIYGACDNTGSSGAATTISVADNSSQSGAANTYTLQTPQALADPGAASAGQQGFLVVCPVTRPLLANDTITITYGNSTTAKAINAQQFAGVHTITPVLSGSYAHTDNESSTTVSVATTPNHSGQVVCALVAVEGGTADSYTQDSDTTNGSWVTLTRRGSGTTTSGSTLNSVYKIVTASGAQTFNPTLGTARDHCDAALVLDWPSSVSGSAAVTLASFTPAGTATEKMTATASPTLASFTTTASGIAGSDITGSASPTLASFTTTTTGTETISGTSAQTLASFTTTTTAVEKMTGSGAVTLSSFTSVGHANIPQGYFPTTASSNGRYIKDQNGNPWMFHGDAAWSLSVNLSIDDVRTYLDSIASNGFNAVLMNGIEHFFATSAPADFYGNSPFTGTALQSSLNEPYWANVDHVIQEAAGRGITVVFFIAYLGFNHGVDGWWSEMAAASNAQVQSYGASLGSRYKNMPNIVWCVGGDYIPTATEIDRYDHMLQGIQGAGDTHLATAHLQRTNDSATTFDSYSWLTLDAVYTGDANCISNAATAYNRTTTRPTFCIEPHYQYRGSPYTLASTRQEQWQVLLVGGLGGHFTGNESVWSFGFNTGIASNSDYAWASHLSDQSYTDAAQVAVLVAAVGISKWVATAPDLSDTFLTSGESTGTAQAAAAYSTDLGLVFVPTNRSITVNLGVMTGHATALVRWFDPTNGSFTAVGTLSTASHVISHPGNNAAGDADWVLVAEATTDISGTVAVTLGSFTPSASGTEAITGTSAVTLGSFTATAPATETISGTSAQTLGSFTPSGSATETISGSGAQTLASFTTSTTGSVANPVSGTVAVTLGSFTPSASGTETMSATGGPTLDPFLTTVSGNVINPNTATGSPTLDVFTTTATGSVAAPVSGTAAPTLDSFTPAGSALETMSASGSPTLGSFSPSGSGTVANGTSGTAAVAPDAFTSSGLGTVGSGINAIGSPTLGSFTTTATGVETVTGSAAPTLDAFAAAAAATVKITGAESATLASFTSTAAAAVTITGSAAPTLGSFTTTASGSAAGTSGAGSPTLASFQSAATGDVQLDLDGSASPSLGDLVCVGAGSVHNVGDIDITGVVTLTDITPRLSLRMLS